MKAVGYFPEASDELEEGVARSQTPGEFRQAVNDALRDVASGLLTAARYPRTRCRQHTLTRFPYSLIYAETATEIQVVAVAHHSRKPGYWKYRLPRP